MEKGAFNICEFDRFCNNVIVSLSENKNDVDFIFKKTQLERVLEMIRNRHPEWSVEYRKDNDYYVIWRVK